MTDGVLTLGVPVVTRKPKRIEIGMGSQATIEQSTSSNDTPSEEREWQAPPRDRLSVS